MTFLKSGVKKSRCTQLSVGLATLFVTYLLFGGESVQADSVARGDDYPLHYKMVVLKSISGGCILASVPLCGLSFE